MYFVSAHGDLVLELNEVVVPGEGYSVEGHHEVVDLSKEDYGFVVLLEDR